MNGPWTNRLRNFLPQDRDEWVVIAIIVVEVAASVAYVWYANAEPGLW